MHALGIINSNINVFLARNIREMCMYHSPILWACRAAETVIVMGCTIECSLAAVMNSEQIRGASLESPGQVRFEMC